MLSVKRFQSSVPKGTVLKGLNVLKQGSDPIAKADDEYPEWLWKLLNPKKKMESFTQEDKLSWTFQRLQSKEVIKRNALLSKTRTG